MTDGDLCPRCEAGTLIQYHRYLSCTTCGQQFPTD